MKHLNRLFLYLKLTNISIHIGVEYNPNLILSIIKTPSNVSVKLRELSIVHNFQDSDDIV